MPKETTGYEEKLGSGAVWKRFTERLGIPPLEGQAVYWCAEYGLPGLGRHGGLGYLAGDHFSQATRLEFPGVFFGLLYEKRKSQAIATDGRNHFWQEDIPEDLPTPEDLDMEPVTNVSVVLNGAWGPNNHINVFRYPLKSNQTSLLLLQVPGEVYPREPDSNARLWNNVVLGFGGYQVARQLKGQGVMKEPAFYHMNESATVLGALAALDDMVGEYGDTPEAYDRALADLRKKTILTNHTLVPAAEASFSWDQCNLYIFSNIKSNEVRNHLASFINERGNRLKFLDLALYLAGRYNGVSQVHAQKSADSFVKQYGTKFYGNNIEFSAVTNGINERTWNEEMADFLEGHGIIDEFGLPTQNSDELIDALNTDELWTVKQKAQIHLQNFLARGDRTDQFGEIINLPDDAINVGDARRFAEYKRRWMMFKYPDILRAILLRHPRVHIFISGKAHPSDNPAKGHLKFVLDSIAGDELFRKRIHYLPNWDEASAKKLVPACHIWLNTPDGNEACGTSGMKTGFGGALQVSTPDGFYPELADGAFYKIEGDTNSEEEFKSYYAQLEKAITDAETPQAWAEGVKRIWKGGLLLIASGARMVGQYTVLGTATNEEGQKT